ncbi:MAG: hypothetical protein K2X27_09495 [Candidatus Obscuribacterales bacterium]|nr:hypothetical protein [Candidatus Obscuribacterales bacterium]
MLSNLPDSMVDQICMQLITLVEEFGGSNVIVTFPHSWKAISNPDSLSPVRVEFSFAKELQIRVENFSDSLVFQYPVHV